MLSSEIRTRPVQSLLVALGLVLSAIVVTMHLHDSLTKYLMDLDVFRDAGEAFVRHTPLYTDGFHTSSGFRFIYPPVAAFLFSALTVVSSTTMQFLWTLGLIVLVWWVLKVALQRMNVERASLLATAALGLTLCIEPMRSNFAFGQINIVLMALVVADCLGVIPKRFRGVGIALAAAIKITPAAFGLLLLLRRDLPSVARAAGGFLGIAAFGYWLRPESSVYFWTHEAWATDRAGDQEFFRNQALTGLIARFDLSESVTKGLWVVGAAVIVAAAAWAANRFLRSDEPVIALGVIALATLLAAPIAVTHHWAYSVLLIAIPIAPQYRRWWPVLLPAALVFLVGPNYLLVDASSHGWVEQAVLELLGNAQCLTGIVLLVAAVVAARSRREAVKPGEAGKPALDTRIAEEAGQPQSAAATT
ncbi:glycosyltransferase family 87 protein [Rhodococcus phenolicus]|uniref:glycosyltransferase family 87 protein n=1 Tax=Rhodococcus phenolicus TaxID=263849 RepID=UPI0008298F2D|nr:glycosyltransferase family 87 protein [Rhodococcus phenolicus]